jgi:hypothetical protein
MVVLLREWLDEIIMYIDVDMMLVNLKRCLYFMFFLIIILNVLLIFRPNIFTRVAQNLQKKYVFKKTVVPFLESERMGFDSFLFNNRKSVATLGILLSLFSFYLLR